MNSRYPKVVYSWRDVLTLKGVSLLDLVIVRAIFILVLAASAYALHPFHSDPRIAGIAGLVFGGGIIFFEIRLERISLKRLIGAAAGSLLGITGAFLMSLVLGKASDDAFLPICLLLLMASWWSPNSCSASCNW